MLRFSVFLFTIAISVALRGRKEMSGDVLDSLSDKPPKVQLEHEIELHEKLAYWDATYVTTQVVFAVFTCSIFSLMSIIGRSKDIIQLFYVSVAVFFGYALSLCISVYGHFPATYGCLFIGFFTTVWGCNAAFEKLGAVVKMARILGVLCILVLITSLLNFYIPIYNGFWLSLPARWFSFIGIHLLISIIIVLGIPRVFGYNSSTSDSSPFLRDFFAIMSVTGLAFGAITQLSLLFYATGLVDDSPLDIVAFFSAKPTISLSNPVHDCYLLGWLMLVVVGISVDHRRSRKELTVAEEMDEDVALMHEDLSLYDSFDYDNQKQLMQHDQQQPLTYFNPQVQHNFQDKFAPSIHYYSNDNLNHQVVSNAYPIITQPFSQFTPAQFNNDPVFSQPNVVDDHFGGSYALPVAFTPTKQKSDGHESAIKQESQRESLKEESAVKEESPKEESAVNGGVVMIAQEEINEEDN